MRRRFYFLWRFHEAEILRSFRSIHVKMGPLQPVQPPRDFVKGRVSGP